MKFWIGNHVDVKFGLGLGFGLGIGLGFDASIDKGFRKACTIETPYHISHPI